VPQITSTRVNGYDPGNPEYSTRLKKPLLKPAADDRPPSFEEYKNSMGYFERWWFDFRVGYSMGPDQSHYATKEGMSWWEEQRKEEEYEVYLEDTHQDYGAWKIGLGPAPVFRPSLSPRVVPGAASNLRPLSISARWRPRLITDPKFANGCEDVARQIEKHIGGEIKTIIPKVEPGVDPKRVRLGPYRGHAPGEKGWAYHEVVVKDGRVNDAFTGHEGLPIED